ncbi:hypothetical protein RhiirA4_459771 [Rhizophagus irregularis]|uniref:Uncharacterized protein n=1 Tax=Rhizophagus irregularis TaxID=588596 RepID=A0A2I1GF51_9GLOM|nr:hypothetical protein RhiirA4_459771 [Rhizophagus irregularis]
MFDEDDLKYDPEETSYDVEKIPVMLKLTFYVLQEAFAVQSMEVVADWIGYRGTATGIMRDKHIKYAKDILDILQKELLLYISTEYGCEKRKAFFLGAIKERAGLAEPAHKLILWQVNIPENENHVQNIDKERLSNFMLTKDISAYLKKCIDSNHEFNLNLAIKAQTITNGLKYFLATGNWKTKKGYATDSQNLEDGKTSITDYVKDYCSGIID